MRRQQPDARCDTCVVSLKEPLSTKAPLIAILEAREPELRVRRAQIIANGFRVREEGVGNNRADRVTAVIRRAGITAPVAKESGHRIGRAWCKSITEHVQGRDWGRCCQDQVPPRGHVLRGRAA